MNDIKAINKSYTQLSNEEKEYIIRIYYEHKNLTYKDLMKYLKVSQRVLSSVMKEYNINSRLKNRYIINSNYFDDINTDEQAYILGFIYADGYVGDEKHNNIVITSKDKDIIEKISKAINYTGDIRITKPGGYENSKEGYSLNFSDKQIASVLRNKYNLQPNKSLILNELPNIKDELFGAFLRGYFDGDGSIGIHKNKSYKNGKLYEYNQLCFTLIATELFINNLIKKLNIKNYSISNSKTLEMKYLKIKSKKELFYLYKIMYDNATISLNRKREIWNKYYKCL